MYTKFHRRFAYRFSYQILRSASPISVNVTYHLLNYGSNLTLGKCLQTEYQLVYNFFHGSDFHEGVRALLIDKDRNPKWNPVRIEDVSTEKILSYFKPMPSGDQLPMYVNLTKMANASACAFLGIFQMISNSFSIFFQ